MDTRLILPEAEPVTIRGEPDYYGASTLIARELGLVSAPVSTSSWVHGCDIFPVPREVFNPHFDNPAQTHLVANQRTQQWWYDQGYTRTVAVGCPILYTRPSGVERIPGSVLVMPNHSLPGCQRDQQHAADWLLMVSKLKQRFDFVMVCLHADDVAELAPMAELAGLSWITGAKHDTLSLPRMRAMFESFEYMVTDVQGSHIPYAAWGGCKVAMLEPLYVRSWDQFKDHPHFVKNPGMRKNRVFHEPENVKARFPFLFVDDLEKATCPREWAEELLGVACQRSPGELARLLGWRWQPDDPAFEGVSYAQAAALLGTYSPDPALAPLQAELERLKVERQKLKDSSRAQAGELKSLQKQQKTAQAFTQSWAAKLSRPIYSVEKRIRRLFTKQG